jgi:hypothetical protein
MNMNKKLLYSIAIPAKSKEHIYKTYKVILYHFLILSYIINLFSIHNYEFRKLKIQIILLLIISYHLAFLILNF